MNPATPQRFDGAEDALENRVDVRGVIVEVEHGFELGGRHLGRHVLVGLELGEEVLALFPRLHGVALDERIGVLAADAGLRQRQQHALGIVQAAELVEVLFMFSG